MSRARIADAPLPAKTVIPFASGWSAVNSVSWPCVYWKDASTGLVLLEGLALSTPAVAANTLVLVGTLPAGFRPTAERRFPVVVYTVAAYVMGMLIVPTNGALQLLTSTAMGAGGHISFDGCIFTAGN